MVASRGRGQYPPTPRMGSMQSRRPNRQGIDGRVVGGAACQDTGRQEGAAVELRTELREAISRVCAVPVALISDDSTLEELGFDSLASAEVLTDLEIRLNRELPLDALRRLVKARTVGEVGRLLEQELRAPSSMA